MGLRLTVAPTVEPVTIAEAKAGITVEHEIDDKLIGRLIRTARDHVERVTWRQLCPATYQLRLREFPCAGILLPRPPLIYGEADDLEITYFDENNEPQTLDPERYQVDQDLEPATIEPAWGTDWPSTYDRPGAVTVTFQAGYASAAAVPESLREAVVKLVGHWYANREAIVTGTIASELPLMVAALVAPYKFRDVRITSDL